MMHLLLSAYPPPRNQMHEYMKLVSSAIASGLTLVAEDENGNTPIFILCERFSMITIDMYPDAVPLMKSLVQVARLMAEKSSDTAAPNTFELANHQGKTIFDLPDYVPLSCLSVCKPYLAELAIPSQVELYTSIQDAVVEYENVDFTIAKTQDEYALKTGTKFVSGLQGRRSLQKHNKTRMTSAQLLSSFYNISPSMMKNQQQPSDSSPVAVDGTPNQNSSSQKRLNFNNILDNK